MLAKWFGGAGDYAPFILRLILAIIFIAHGYQKIFVYTVPGVAQNFESMGLNPPIFWAWVVSLVEFVGGILVLVGLFTRFVALLFVIQMLVAILKVHLTGGFFLPTGYEYALTILFVSAALLFTGPRALSIEGAMKKELL